MVYKLQADTFYTTYYIVCTFLYDYLCRNCNVINVKHDDDVKSFKILFKLKFSLFKGFCNNAVKDTLSNAEGYLCYGAK